MESRPLIGITTTDRDEELTTTAWYDAVYSMPAQYVDAVRRAGGNPVLLLVVALIWGFAVVADSAQFSAAVSELSPPKYVGTALTLQTSLGFLLTLFSIRLIPPLVDLVGWRFAFASLALGPIAGIWAMQSLRRSPAAVKLAGGKK